MTHEVPQLDLKDHASPPLPVFILSHHLGVGDGEGKGVGDGEGEGVGDGETKYHRKLLSPCCSAQVLARPHLPFASLLGKGYSLQK